MLFSPDAVWEQDLDKRQRADRLRYSMRQSWWTTEEDKVAGQQDRAEWLNNRVWQIKRSAEQGRAAWKAIIGPMNIL